MRAARVLCVFRDGSTAKVLVTDEPPSSSGIPVVLMNGKSIEPSALAGTLMVSNEELGGRLVAAGSEVQLVFPRENE